MPLKSIRKVQVEATDMKFHTSHKSLFSDTPQGYEFVLSEKTFKSGLVPRLKKYKVLRFANTILIRFLKINKIFRWSMNYKPRKDADILFTSVPIANSSLPWVMEILDHPYVMEGYSYKLFNKYLEKNRKMLASEMCKRIICENTPSLKIMKKYFPELASKMILVLPALKPQIDKAIEKNNKKTKVLFIGSINNPQDFYPKGGLEIIETAKYLKDENIEFIIRCKIPEDLRSQVLQLKNITLLEKELPIEDIRKLYLSADMLLLPGHHFHLMASLEAMSYGLPIIALDTYAFSDFIKSGINGFLVKKSENIRGYLSEEYPNNVRKPEFIQEIQNPDKEVIKQLSEKVVILSKNKQLRKKMGNESLRLLKIKFSPEKRNKLLKTIFDAI